ncbi:MAG: hypothetical protein J1E40_08265 [Oscillospiraceae bacterium]|nr:hypothetical protein [Oscillospiraceae bacterium]
MKLAEKLGELLGKNRFENKFENDFKNALKRQDFYIAEKESDTVYEVSNGTDSFKLDIGEAKRQYEMTHSEEILERLVSQLEQDFRTEGRMVSFTNGQEFLRLMIMREQEINGDMIYMDFVEGLKKVVVYTSNDETIHHLDESLLKRWGVPREVVFSVADRNMCKILSKAEIGEETLCGDIKALDFKISSPVLCSSLILCNDFRSVVYERLGAKFLVVAPSRESLLVLKNITNDILEGLGTVILSEYRKAKNPLTTDVLLFTPQGIQVAGRFSIGRDSRAVSSEDNAETVNKEDNSSSDISEEPDSSAANDNNVNQDNETGEN